jgi:hypothetical protein
LEIITPQVITDGLVVNTIGQDGGELNLLSDTIFFGRPYFNSDTAGFAIIREGERFVDVSFDKEYLTQPVVNATISFDGDENLLEMEEDPGFADQIRALQESHDEVVFAEGYQFIVTRKNVKGFRIYLNKPAAQDIQFSWIALAVKDAKISINSGDEEKDDVKIYPAATETNFGEKIPAGAVAGAADEGDGFLLQSEPQPENNADAQPVSQSEAINESPIENTADPPPDPSG